MYKIENKETQIALNDSGPDRVKYSHLALAIAQSDQKAGADDAGFTDSEMAARLEIIEQLQAADGKIVLENAEYELFVTLMNQHKWRSVIHQDIVDFAKAMRGAEKINPRLREVEAEEVASV